MANTLYSLGVSSAVESWRNIRSIRAEPRGELKRTILGDRARQREFHMSLEQAQQQFSASEAIGYESRPLNLFYGISQAGRALASGSNRLGRGTGEQWQANGHGVKFDSQFTGNLFEALVLRDEGAKDLFSRASISCGSPVGFGSVKFGALVNQLVDYTMTFREAEAYPRPLHDVYLSSVHRPFPTVIEVSVPGVGSEVRPSADEVRVLLEPYPALKGVPLDLNEDGSVRWSHNPGRCFLQIKGESELEWIPNQNGARTLKGASDYRGTSVLLPACGSCSDPIRPLMAWWLVLYSLSMVSRYAPSKWGQVLSISESPIASRIEFLLDSALEAVPDLVSGELRRMMC